jgi:hypothetical protein
MAEGDPIPAVITAESLGALQGDAFKGVLPADFKEKPYLKDAATFSDVLKKLDGAQTLLGQRFIPAAEDPEEKQVAFYGKLRPETPDKYVIPDTIEGLPPEFAKKAGESKFIKDLLHSANISQYQAKPLIAGFLKLIYSADMATTKRHDDAFVKMATDLFGNQKDNIIANGKKFLAANLPDNVKPLLEGMSEKELTVILAATDMMAKKFTGEDPFRGGGGGGGGGGETKETITAKMQEIMKNPDYKDPFKNRALLQQMDGLREKLRIVMGGQ